MTIWKLTSLAMIVLPLGVAYAGCGKQFNKQNPSLNAKDYYADPISLRLLDAIEHNDIEQMQSLLSKGADVNAEGRFGLRPIFWAMATNQMRSFEFLLKNGASLKFEVQPRTPNDGRAEPFMELASGHPSPEWLRLSLEHGGDANQLVGKDGRTIIFEAVILNRVENVRLLADKGARLDQQDISGSTPLTAAAGNGHFHIVYLLLGKGADPTIKDRWGYDLVAGVALYGKNGRRPMRSGEYPWYAKVIAELKSRGLLTADLDYSPNAS